MYWQALAILLGILFLFFSGMIVGIGSVFQSLKKKYGDNWEFKLHAIQEGKFQLLINLNGKVFIRNDETTTTD